MGGCAHVTARGERVEAKKIWDEMQGETGIGSYKRRSDRLNRLKKGATQQTPYNRALSSRAVLSQAEETA
eukprot:3586618-Pleurochrysis_carterae.AAC.1